ncbi:MAG: enoyl-CoA hydratase/isomerase family protein [Polyangiaceae bacterium]
MSLHVETAGAAVVLKIDRPQRHNAIDRATAMAIGDAVRKASADPAVRAVILTAAGDRVFCAGGDLNEIQAALDAGTPAAVSSVVEPLATIEDCEVPVIAAVQGDVFGGGAELLMLCDLVIIEEHVHIAFRHARMGLSPAWGGLTRLLERVGPLEASRILLTAEKVTAGDALRIGLVSEVVPRGFVQERALARASHIADNPRDTVAALKRTLREARAAIRAPAVAVEREAFLARWGGPDHLAAMQAFRDRK